MYGANCFGSKIDKLWAKEKIKKNKFKAKFDIIVKINIVIYTTLVIKTINIKKYLLLKFYIVIIYNNIVHSIIKKYYYYKKQLSLMMALIERYPNAWHMLIVRPLFNKIGSGVQVS